MKTFKELSEGKLKYSDASFKTLQNKISRKMDELDELQKIHQELTGKSYKPFK